MFYDIGVISVFLLLLIGLVLAWARDSAGRKNNVLLIYYTTVAIWGTACIGGIVVDLKAVTAKRSVSVQSRSKSRTRMLKAAGSGSLPVGGHYGVVLWGMIINSVIYVLRRPEWARMIIDAIRAWSKGRAQKYWMEMLIQQGIHHPEDREWTKEMVGLVLRGGETDLLGKSDESAPLPEITEQEINDH